MTHNILRGFCALLAAGFLCMPGCAANELQSSEITADVVDFGSMGGVNYSGTASAAETAAPQTEVQTTASATETSHEGSSEAASQAETTEKSAEPQTTSATKTEPQTTTTAKTEPQTTTTTKSEPQTTSAAKTEPQTTTTTKAEPQTTTAAKTEPQTADYDFGASSYQAVNYSEIKGIWISYIELAEIMQGQSRSAFASNIGEVFDNCVSLGINTVYVHVRSHGDAYYSSELFPWSKYITGTLGKDPGYDPLEIMIEQAHKRGLSFQAWINPLRCCASGEISSCAGYPVYSFATADGTAGKYAVNVGGTYYLNPAYDEVIELITAGAREILANYDVDGLHIDDYFYPTTDASFDSSAFSESAYSSLSEFRFANCDSMVSGLYSAVKSTNPTAVFSVSVQGKIDNNYSQLYADVRKWCTNSGYLDVIIPQIYYGFENSSAPYEDTLAEWEELAAKGGIPLAAGLSVSKVGCEDTWAGSGKYEWINNTDILSRQLSLAKRCSSYGGFALYSYRSVFTPSSAVSAQVETEISALKELI